METSNMKNIVVLKNLPSNIVEEAIVILKGNKKIKKLELADKKNSKNVQNEEFKNKEYILKEAEMLVSNYIDKTQDYKNGEKNTKKDKKKIKILKRYSIVVTVLLLISLVLNIF